jgi:amino acid permease
MTASMLTLPETVSRLGVFPYMISVCLSSLLSYAGFYLIISVLAEKKSETYGEMVGEALGPNMRKLSKIILAIKNWTQTIIV